MAFSLDTYKQLVTKAIVRELAVSWGQNGHKLTNKLIDSIIVKIFENTDSILIEGYMFNYGSFMDRGVKSANIPYSGSTGKGGKSLYIEGLKKYVEQRIGLADKEALSMAFAIAAKHKKIGMPVRTRGNGTNWIGKGADNFMPEVSNLSMRYIDQIVVAEFEKIKI
jgi:hypothetical protein